MELSLSISTEFGAGYWDDWHNYGYYHAYATQNPPTDPSSFCLKLHGDDDYDSASKISLNASWLASRPWLDYAGPVTRVYNCHAYAWIVPEYWLEDPLPFKNTIYFTWRTTNGAADDDWKIIFKNGSVVTHSAVVLYGGADADSIYVIQKMGTMGLYMTYLDSLLYTDYPGDYYTFSGS
ncbi:MAG: hypothetical protein GX602_07145 [Dehalococcoidales bacterium]|nr:hypothetical protein [Dehalococcoidales bacterium]